MAVTTCSDVVGIKSYDAFIINQLQGVERRRSSWTGATTVLRPQLFSINGVCCSLQKIESSPRLRLILPTLNSPTNS